MCLRDSDNEAYQRIAFNHEVKGKLRRMSENARLEQARRDRAKDGLDFIQLAKRWREKGKIDKVITTPLAPFVEQDAEHPQSQLAPPLEALTGPAVRDALINRQAELNHPVFPTSSAPAVWDSEPWMSVVVQRVWREKKWWLPLPRCSV